MQKECDALMVLCSVPDAAEGEKIARALVKEGLCACVNRLPGLTSCYIYEGEFCEESEELLLIKTATSHYGLLEARICELHSYDVPEIIAVDITEGAAPYLKWLGGALKPLV